MLTVEQAIEQVFGRDTEERELVLRLLTGAIRANPSQGESVILLFTGYGPKLAGRAHELWSHKGPFARSRVWVFGPDSLAWKGNKKADAEWYGRWLEKLGVNKADIKADASAETSSTPGQARIAARRAREVGTVRNFVLVTAAYHQPRAYMTLLKALQDRELNEINIYPRPLMPKDNDWGTTDSELSSKVSCAAALRTDEAPKIFKYQEKGDVASWPTLRGHLDQIGVD